MKIQYQQPQEWVPVREVREGTVAMFEGDVVDGCAGLYLVCDPEGKVRNGEGSTMIVRISDGVVKVVPNGATCRPTLDAFLVVPRE